MRRLFELCAADRDVRFSPYVWPVRMALRHKGLPFESVACTFLEKEGIAPSGGSTFPVLQEEERWVPDSLAIARHLERAHPERPLFGGALGLAQAGLVHALILDRAIRPLFPLIAADVCAALDDPSAAYFRATRTPRVEGSLEDAAEGREDALPRLQAGFAPFRRALDAGSFLSGDAPAYADYGLFGAFQWCRVISPFAPLAGDAVMNAWFERMLDLFGGEGRRAKRAAA
ncbi:MAG: glutathione S-transferase N-terminal domain-containing protein [Myxococcota bacterium]